MNPGTPSISFTGPRNQQMSMRQIERLSSILDSISVVRPHAHHGMCLGSDLNFHNLCRLRRHYYIVGHPGVGRNGKCFSRAACECDVVLPPKLFLLRDHDIVDASPVLLSTPSSRVEAIRSGTWTTIRYARKQKVKIVLIFPDGTIREEN